jgi:hypothetical protein
VLSDAEYAGFYRDRSEAGEFVILDNSVIELGYPLGASELIMAAKTIKAAEVVLPDRPGESDFTLTQVKAAGPGLKAALPDTKLMAVPQGRSVGEWFISAQDILDTGYVGAIGIGKFLGSMRQVIVEELDRIFSRQGAFWPTDFHLLGTWGNPIEIKDLAGYEWIRGVDSKLPVRLGLRGITLHPAAGMLSRIRPEPMHFDDDVDLMPHITSWNVGVFDAWANNYPVTFDDFDWRPSAQTP